MRRNSTYIFIGFSSLALAALLFIQVSWLLETARVKEELFNEKANMVLSRTAQELCADKQTCMNMGSCCLEENDSTCALKLNRAEAVKIDSLLRHFMQYYNLHIEYSFEVIQPGRGFPFPGAKARSANVFQRRLEQFANVNGLELKLILPEKKTFILQEMGVMFIASILLIIIVFVLFVRTIRSLQREKRISEFTTDFLNNMTHEFKTPLTNIGLAGKRLLKEEAVMQHEKARRFAGIVLSENEKLKLQVEQVLSMTALERGEIPVALADTDVHAILEDALRCISVQVENKEGELKATLAATQHVAAADRSHLTNAFCNLVDNAIKYSPGKPLITIETSNAGGRLLVKISDRGIGIDKAFQEKIFEKYFRVPTGNVHDVKGFGLGLAYVRKIIELHGGTIGLASQKGQGTTFTISLPLSGDR
jgi:two-component system, OmpR family, phosphate regulon sensor histidine kinase PhoR